MTSEHSKSYH